MYSNGLPSLPALPAEKSVERIDAAPANAEGDHVLLAHLLDLFSVVMESDR
jgi:hypothetical protein